jgi:hypothetical protein
MAVRDGRKLVVFTFSDFDPSGYQMPVSIGVKLICTWPPSNLRRLCNRT